MFNTLWSVTPGQCVCVSIMLQPWSTRFSRHLFTLLFNGTQSVENDNVLELQNSIFLEPLRFMLKCPPLFTPRIKGSSLEKIVVRRRIEADEIEENDLLND